MKARLKPAALGLALLALAVAGCRAEPETPLKSALRMRQAPPAYSALHEVASAAGANNPLHVRERGLAGVTLGMAAPAVQARLGPARRQVRASEGTWWEYEDGSLRLLLAGTPATLVQVQAWAPTRYETETLLRPLDPATRLERKYGVAPERLAHAGGEVWLYPAADAAFVVSAPSETGERAIMAVFVGL